MHFLLSSYYIILYITSLFFFIDPATTEIYTLSLHDALPISLETVRVRVRGRLPAERRARRRGRNRRAIRVRSEEHTSELQSHVNLVCRLLLEKKKKKKFLILFFIRFQRL